MKLIKYEETDIGSRYYYFSDDDNDTLELRVPARLIYLIQRKATGKSGEISFSQLEHDIKNLIIDYEGKPTSYVKQQLNFSNLGRYKYDDYLIRTVFGKDKTKEYWLLVDSIIIVIKNITLTKETMQYKEVFEKMGLYVVRKIFILDNNTVAKINMLENGLTEKEIKQLSKLKTTQEIN